MSSRRCSCMWIQTLPNVVQVNILTFLSAEHSLFRSMDLELLGLGILSASEVEIWVVRAAQDLLLKVSRSNKVLEETERKCSSAMMNNALPDWIHLQRHSQRLLVPWLPLKASIPGSTTSKPQCYSSSGKDELRMDEIAYQTNVPLETNLDLLTNESAKNSFEDEVIGLKTPPCLAEGKGGRLGEDITSPSSSTLLDDTKELGLRDIQENSAKLAEVESGLNGTTDMNAESAVFGLSSDMYSRAQALRNSWLEMRPRAEDVDLLRQTQDSSALLRVIKPWEMGDDVVLCIIEALMGREDGFSWCTQILSYCLLPKLISLEQPASRVLISAVLLGSKLHPRAAVDALLVPLILSDGGPNTSQCDVINRTMKECLADHHVVSFFRKIVLQDRRQQLPFAAPLSFPPNILGRSVVWSDALCALVQNFCNRLISLDEELIDGLVNILGEVVEKLTKSLKFSNLLLCFISNYGPFLKHHKSKLRQIAEKTDTFMTKSILGKSSAL